MTHQRTVGILVFDDVEVLDFCGPFEVFAVSRSNDNRDDSGKLFTVLTIAEEARIVRCRGGLLVQPHHTIADHPPLDILVVPGGAGVVPIYEGNVRVLDWIAAQAAQVELASSVCTGALLLAQRGLLDGKQATTHWSSIARLREHHPAIDVIENARFVDEGRIITSAGVSAGIDMALHVVERLCGDDVATRTARIMEYDRRTAPATAWEAQG